MDWFGLGKKRSKLGKWLDRHGVAQIEVEKATKLSRGTISRLCNDDENVPTMKNANKIIKFLRKLDPDVDYDDFWSM
ncbi:transcriptional regulator [Anaerobacillus alkalilacustris]|uniref:Transcriptional regulator n=1 Tax=Anaerobacillus alkalilacustris TaxID=393763 RepID=A0A1S2LX35_9BACI|nr:helix-turn-helix domain-containing protein [Anaerobacillus alkalilacustris]OIJ17101.1 transcriptional regulator [Anaerobacillus alkalilacustris]